MRPWERGATGTMFDLEANGTTVRTELIAGLTTYLTMVYIAFVNPTILAAAGMDKGAVFVATCLAAAFGSALMGLYANYPVGRACCSSSSASHRCANGSSTASPNR